MSSAGAASEEFRTWTDDTGSFTLEAKYVGDEGETIRLLRRTDGKIITVPLSRLSEADRKFVERARKARSLDNPFDG